MRMIVISLSLALACGGTVLAQQSTVVFDNQSGEPALVKLVGPTSKDVEVPTGAKVAATASAGHYIIKVRYGTPGRYHYAKGEEFEVKETSATRSEITITLHKVVSGNYETEPISEAEFKEGQAGTPRSPQSPVGRAATRGQRAQGEATSPSASEAVSWSSDVLAFRKAVVAALDAVKPNITSSGFGTPIAETSGADAALAPFKGKQIQWRITFTGVDAEGGLEFQETMPGNKRTGSFVGKPEDFVAFIINPDPHSLAQWRALPKNSLVRCQATVSMVMVSTRFSAGNQFAGWMPIFNLEEARPLR